LVRELDDADVLIMAAAVSDYRLARPFDAKIKRARTKMLELELEAGPDLLASTRGLREERGVFTVGFALETDDPVENASRKLEEKGIDLMAVNEAGRADRGPESETNQVILIGAEGVIEEIPLMPKPAVAERLLDRLESRIP
jgi:phosphopantothenoylcysteine decarboxylase/phosphopantothenate--cysteine ligase